MSVPNSAARLAEPPAPPEPRRPASRADLLAVAAAVLLVGAAAAVGLYYNRPGSGVVIFVSAPPLFADWLPHVGPGSLFAVLIAAAVVLWGPALAARLSWRRGLIAGYFASLAWIFSLAMVDGWGRGFAGHLTIPQEYLHEVPGITDIPGFLREFSSRI